MIRYRPKAVRHLREIALYSRREWGDEAAAVYMGELRDAVKLLAAMHHLGREVPRRPGLRSWRRNRHVIYYLREGEDVVVVAVLHEKQLPTGHL